MKKLYLSLVLGVLFFCNTSCTQSTSTQEIAINTTALNSIMNQGYEFKGIVGNCVVVSKDYMNGILKTDGQWLVKPSSDIEIAPFYNVILFQKINNNENSEEKKLFDAFGKEVISTKFYSTTSEDEIELMEYKFQLQLINCLLGTKNTIKELPKPLRIRDIEGKEINALKDGYLMAGNGNVLDKNGKLIFNDESVEYCENGIFYKKETKTFVDVANRTDSLALNTLLKNGYIFDENFGNCYLFMKDNNTIIVNAKGQKIIDTEFSRGEPIYNIIPLVDNDFKYFIGFDGDVKGKIEMTDSPEIETCTIVNLLLETNETIQINSEYYMYSRDFNGDDGHITRAIEDGFWIFVDFESDMNGVMDKKGNIVIKTEDSNDIIYCGNGLFAIEEGRKKHSFTLIK